MRARALGLCLRSRDPQRADGTVGAPKSAEKKPALGRRSRVCRRRRPRWGVTAVRRHRRRPRRRQASETSAATTASHRQAYYASAGVTAKRPRCRRRLRRPAEQSASWAPCAQVAPRAAAPLRGRSPAVRARCGVRPKSAQPTDRLCLSTAVTALCMRGVLWWGTTSRNTKGPSTNAAHEIRRPGRTPGVEGGGSGLGWGHIWSGEHVNRAASTKQEMGASRGYREYVDPWVVQAFAEPLWCLPCGPLQLAVLSPYRKTRRHSRTCLRAASAWQLAGVFAKRCRGAQSRPLYCYLDRQRTCQYLCSAGDACMAHDGCSHLNNALGTDLRRGARRTRNASTPTDWEGGKPCADTMPFERKRTGWRAVCAKGAH